MSCADRVINFPGQVMVHTPEAFPDVSIGYKVHAVRDRVSRISVSVAQVKADNSLDRLGEQNSQCFMYNKMAADNESNNEDSCYSNCRMKSMYHTCNCTMYFFKLYKGDANNGNPSCICLWKGWAQY